MASAGPGISNRELKVQRLGEVAGQLDLDASQIEN